ncbi:ATP-binding protein [Achromobacter arsenitoxydans]|uniref:Virulence sensor protein BvgS n=1 Tax=Achromobacter arsenitoxydans SY8 TaxID=477184 RepID=H0F800_9BURK|nr:ATP-binding protein [Achromobacter arsenitoxydans]EHK65433.1 periplasmic sensor hybrid histidine kinase [Achromobacter arsenitoxydans SY8]
MLLHFFAAALLACIVAGAIFFLYWSFANTVSTYRRQMNAAAYNAQLFFDQRESLLRSLASSSVQNTDHAPTSETPTYFGNTRQIQVLPLHEETNAYDWALILTPRDLNDIALARTQLLFTSLRSGRTSLVGQLAAEASPHMDAATQSWIAGALASQNPSAPAGGASRIVWLKPPMDPANQLYLYTPVDPSNAEAGWIGLSLGNFGAAIDGTSFPGGGYALFDQNDAPVMYSPAAAPLLPALDHRASKEDAFGWLNKGLLPRFVALNKSMGDAGWRLVYFTPVNRILGDTAYQIQATLAGAMVLFAAVILGIRHIKRKLVAPALRQYQALADSVALNRRLVEVAPVGLCLLRRNDGTPLLSNEQAREWLLGDFELLTKLLAPNDSYTGREFVLHDGRCVYLTFASIMFQGEDAILCSISDITAFKRVERTITQAKLHADAANQAKTEFLTTMSHEIRTPLFGILGTLEMLSLTAMDEQQQQYLDTMQQSSATLLCTINDTLDLSRIEAGYLELESVEYSPSELLDSVVSSYAARADAKGLRIYALPDAATPAAVRGDVTRVRQILNNLVSNAIKFTSSGHVVLRLQTLKRDARAVTVKFQVADTGMGIPPEHHAQVFEPYFRTESGRSQAVPGTGLGLAISRRLSEIMGGTLTAVSEPGLGTSMSLELTLPLGAEPQSDMAIRLDPTPVFVRGAVTDVVNNLCQWLRLRGAVAIPYRSALDCPLDGGVLVDAWPHTANPAPWVGARVIAQPPGVGPRTERGRNGWIANAHSLTSIVAAVRLAQDGVAAKVTLERRTSGDALDMHLLVAEDNPISRQILQEQLEHLGCSVVTAVNGKAALNCPDLSVFDAILTDLQMPELDGYGLARALRARGYKRPVVGITANAFTDDMRRSVDAGITTVLLKPLPISALRDALIALKEFT